MNTGFYSTKELESLGLSRIGVNVLISRNAKIYCPEKVNIGSNVRIDDFCILSGNIEIGNFIHISALTVLTGGFAGIAVSDFATISQRVNIFANSDDYSGETMANPLIPEKFKNLDQAKVSIKKHALIGCGSVIMPGVTLETGSAIGALSFVNRSTDPWMIYAGIPARAVKKRAQKLLELEKEFLASLNTAK